jgi:hypothetical protein
MVMRLAGVSQVTGGATTEVIVVIIAAISLIVDDHVVQDDVSTHDQIESALRVRLTIDD